MNTDDNQAVTTDPDLGGGAIDNDAYTGTEGDSTARTEETPPGGEGATLAPEDDEEEFLFDGSVLDSPSSADDGSADDTPLVKQLRQTIKDQRKEIREKRISAPESTAASNPQPIQLPPMPKMEDEGIDYDPDVYQQKLTEWYEQKARADQQQAQQQQTQEARLKDFNTKKEAYKARSAAMKVRGYEDAEAFVAGELPNEVQTALILHAEKPEHVVLALARNPELMKQMKAVTDPVSLGVLIGTIQAKAKAMPKGKTSVSGAPADPRAAGTGQPQNIDAEIEKARESGDYTRVMQLKRKKNATAK